MSDLPGVSVVICTHNGARRVPTALAHLASQHVPPRLPWEVVVVDNAATDAAARGSRPDEAAAPTRMVAEPVLGLGHARMRGLDEARHDVFSFVDDDNWVAPDWVATVSEIMASHPEAGACGGLSEAVLESEPPEWFERFDGYWAVGPQAERAEEVGQLWGAGLAVRRAAWCALRADGFTLSLAGRAGTALTTGEDLELCAALRLAGWRLRYDPRLRLRHFMPAARLTWDYARRLLYGWGVASVALDPYLMAKGPPGLRARLLRLWTWRLAAVTIRLVGQAMGVATRPGEGSSAVLRYQTLRGRLHGLRIARREWHARARRVREARWLAR